MTLLQPSEPEKEPMLPPTEGQVPPQIEASRGIGNRILKRFGFDDESLDEANILRSHEAQAAESVARGIGEPRSLSEAAQKRAQAIASKVPENIEHVDKIAS